MNLKSTNRSLGLKGLARLLKKKINKYQENSSPPVISFLDFLQLFTLITDASNVACGAILMQEADNGKKNIIAVASHTFNPTEQNWSTIEQEAYTIKWAVLKFDYFLRNRPFVIFTDHRSLTSGSTRVQQCQNKTVAGRNLMLQIYPWVRGGQIECMGWYAQQRLQTQEGENMQWPNPGRQNIQVRRPLPSHLRPFVVY